MKISNENNNNTTTSINITIEDEPKSESYVYRLKKHVLKLLKKLIPAIIITIVFFNITGSSYEQFFSSFEGVAEYLVMVLSFYQLITIFLFVYHSSSEKSSGKKGGVVASLVITLIVILLLTLVIGPWLLTTLIMPLGIDFDSGFGYVLKTISIFILLFGFFIFDFVKLIYFIVKAIIEKRNKDGAKFENGYGIVGVKHYDSVEEADKEKKRQLKEEKSNLDSL